MSLLPVDKKQNDKFVSAGVTTLTFAGVEKFYFNNYDTGNVVKKSLVCGASFLISDMWEDTFQSWILRVGDINDLVKKGIVPITSGVIYTLADMWLKFDNKSNMVKFFESVGASLVGDNFGEPIGKALNLI